MKNWKLRLGVSCVAITAVALAWACNDVNNESASATTSSSSTSAGSGTGSVTSTGTATNSGSSATSSSTPPTFGPLIDDMAMIQSDGPNTLGSWYTYSDRSIANSEPPIILGTPPGSINPIEGASFPTDNGDGGLSMLSLDGSTVNYRECWGGGEKTWGAGFGMDLFDSPPDGGMVSINACPGEAGIFDTAPDAGSVGIPLPFDASAYTGFAFYGISLTGKNYMVNVQWDDDQTSPWGGECNVCQNGGKCSLPHTAGTTTGCPCSDDYLETVEFTPSWQLFVIRWTDKALKDGNSYSNEGALTFHKNKMYNIHFQFSLNGSTAPLPDFDVAVAYLQWVTN